MPRSFKKTESSTTGTSWTTGDRAWVGLAAYIIAYDVFAGLTKRETLSMSFARALDAPVRRWPTIVMWVYITAHLFRLVPRRYDPLRRWA